MDISSVSFVRSENSCKSTDCNKKLQTGSLPTKEHQQVSKSKPPQPESSLSRKTRQKFWEPCLVPSEVGGKIEMVTALKRVDSDYISSPRINPRTSTLHIVKEPEVLISSKIKLLSPSSDHPPTNVMNPKDPAGHEAKPGIRKEMISKKKIADKIITEQMGKAIAKKEAAILKEIEKAVREASCAKTKADQRFSMKKKSSVYDPSSSKPMIKDTTTRLGSSKMKDNSQADLSGPEESQDCPTGIIDERKSTCMKSKDQSLSGVTPTQTVPEINTKTLPSVSTVTKMMPGLSNVVIAPAGVNITSSTSKPITTDSLAMSTILTVPKSVVVTSSSGVTIPKNIQAVSNVFCESGNIITAPGLTAPALTDPNAVTQVITLPVDSMSSQRRIVLLTDPTHTLASGSLPLLTSIFPTSSMPVMRSSINSSSRTSLRRKIAPKNTDNGKEVKNTNRTISASSQKNKLPMKMENSGVGTNLSSNVKPVDLEKQNECAGENSVLRVRRTYRNNKSSLDATSKPQVKDQTTALTTQTPPKRNQSQSAKKNDSTEKKSQKETSTDLRNQSQSFIKDSEKVDCNGENLDVDDEFISEELEQGIDDSKNVNAVTKKSSNDDVFTRETRLKEREKKHLKLSKTNVLKSSDVEHDASDVLLENRLQRIEELYNEIPPRKPQIIVTENDMSKIKDNFQDSILAIKAISASFKSLVSQSSSLGSKEYSHSSCQTDADTGNNITEKSFPVVPEENQDDVEPSLMLCRLCGGSVKKNSLISLFGKQSRNRKLVSMLSTILPQIPSIKESDSLPKQVCTACVDKLILCHSAINQFLEADLELRQALEDEKSVTSSSRCAEEKHCISSPKTANDEPLTIQSQSVTHHQSCQVLKDPEVPPVQSCSQKRGYTAVDSTRPHSDSSISNNRHKRKRSKSPSRSEPVLSTKASSSSQSSRCIDLSRLDPEFNDGFEVEWCLDEETIRSSMVPEEELGDTLKENSASAPASVSAEGPKSDVDKIISDKCDMQKCAASSDSLELHQVGSSQKKAKDTKDSLRSETSKLKDKVSMLSEVHTSVCELPAKSDAKQRSSVLQDGEIFQPFHRTRSQDKFMCSSCPLSFCSKQEAFLHKVMQHEEELTGILKTSDVKQDICLTKDQNLQKPSSSSESKNGKQINQESMMCDQCGLPFPNEYSLQMHVCGAQANSTDPHLLFMENKIFESKENVKERATCGDKSEASLTGGKILVKCGKGMLWVNSSKYFSEEPMAAIKTSNQCAMAGTKMQSDTVRIKSLEQSISKFSSGGTAKVQFAYKCDHCKSIYHSRDELLNHLQTHVDQEYKCNECDAKFPTLKALNNHIPSHIPPDCVCDVCGLILPDSRKLLQHKKEHTHHLPHMCDVCGKRFPNEQTLEVHETVHYNKKGPLSCSLCRKCFFFKYSFVRHRSQHASNRLQKCSLCFRVLNSSDLLRKHVALHHLMKNFVCFCKQIFQSQKELVEHRYLKHSYAEIFCARNKVEIIEPLPLHQCSICLRVLNSKQSLYKHHVTFHSSTWPFYCIRCSRKYTSMLHLARHECHRKNLIAFQCRVCGKAFQNKNIFRQHKVIHNFEKWKYICRHCGKAFQKSQLLVSHIMTHGGKRFLCPRCYLPCQDKEGLLKHYNLGSCQMKGKIVR